MPISAAAVTSTISQRALTPASVGAPIHPPVTRRHNPTRRTDVSSAPPSRPRNHPHLRFAPVLPPGPSTLGRLGGPAREITRCESCYDATSGFENRLMTNGPPVLIAPAGNRATLPLFVAAEALSLFGNAS